jgi:hypothetical protein
MRMLFQILLISCGLVTLASNDNENKKQHFYLNQQYKVLIHHSNNANFTSFEDSFYITFLNKKYSEFTGSHSNYSFAGTKDSIFIYGKDYQKQFLKNEFWLFKSHIYNLVNYTKLKGFLWKKSINNKAEDILYQNRFYDRMVRSNNWFRSDTIFFIDIENDNKWYIHDSTNYFITLDSSSYQTLPIIQNSISKIITGYEDCDSLFPFSYINIDGDLDSVVVIYSYLGCPPCMKLKNDLTKLVRQGDLDSNTIKIVNVKDSSFAIENYKRRSKLPFEYLKVNAHCKYGTYPIIAGYSKEGNLLWYDYGYDKLVIRKISIFTR